MQSPIAITVHPTLGPVVSGRALYPLITKSKAIRNIFSDWFREKEKRFNLQQGEDFAVGSIVIPETGSKREHIEFILTLKTARLLCKEAPANRGLTTLAYLDVYGKGPFLSPDSTTVLSPNAAQLGTADLNNETLATLPFGPVSEPTPVDIQLCPPVEVETVVPTPLEKMESYVSGLATTTGPIETRAQRLRRELAEAEEAERLEALQKDTPALVVDPQRLDDLEVKVNGQGSKLDALLQFFQKAANILATHVPVDEPTVRMKVNRIVDAYASSAKMEHAAVWKYLYGQLLSQYNIDVYSMAASKKDPNYLEAVEAAGKIDLLYGIAQASLIKQPTTGATA